MQPKMNHDLPTSDRRLAVLARRMRPRRFAFAVSLLGLMVAATAIASYSEGADAASGIRLTESTPTTLYPITGLAPAFFSAELKGADVASVAEMPVATLNLRYDPDAEAMRYELEVTALLAAPTKAAICQGSVGQAGRTVLVLFDGSSIDGDFTGVLAEGAIVQDDLVGPLKNDTLADLMELLRNGGAYVTIGTSECPVDAARGQIH